MARHRGKQPWCCCFDRVFLPGIDRGRHVPLCCSLDPGIRRADLVADNEARDGAPLSRALWHRRCDRDQCSTDCALFFQYRARQQGDEVCRTVRNSHWTGSLSIWYGVGPSEVADSLEHLCRKGQYYDLKVHFFDPKTYLQDKESAFGQSFQTAKAHTHVLNRDDRGV